MDVVRVTGIKITRLFDDINYDIYFPEDKAISIITAPNGCGKTTMLNILAYVLNPTYENFKTFRGVPFDTFSCSLSNGKTIQLQKIAPDETMFSATEKRNASVRKVEGRTSLLLNNGDFRYVVTQNGKPCGTPPVSFAKLINSVYHDDQYSLLDDDDEYQMPRGRPNSPEFSMRCVQRALTRYLEQIGCNKPVNFIRADRIQPVEYISDHDRRFSPYEEPHPTSPLDIACEELGKIIAKETEAYNNEVSVAKDKLPQMFLDGEGSGLSYPEFTSRWAHYRGELNKFQNIGLIAPTEDFTEGKDMKNVYDEGKGAFLSTYLQAFEGTTTSLSNLYERLRLFKDILDERNAITGKRVIFGKKGISMYARDREIKLTTLSSGEKHDLIMFYNLIFNIEKNGIVLIDEPEISLHIAWQESYLDNLIAICEMNGLQAIIATHSPNIVSSHYDCVVDKGESHG